MKVKSETIDFSSFTLGLPGEWRANEREQTQRQESMKLQCTESADYPTPERFFPPPPEFPQRHVALILHTSLPQIYPWSPVTLVSGDQRLLWGRLD